MDQGLLLDYFLVGMFGAMVGTTELLSRYRDAPLRAVISGFAAGYIIINVLAAMLALWLLRLFGVNFGLDPVTDIVKLRWVQVLTAGFASMMLFRSSVFVLQVGDQDVSVGPSSILDVLLTVLDREIDRKRARERAKEVEIVMENISFTKAREQLPVVAFALMQNLAREDQDQIVNKVLQLSTNSNLTDNARSTALGLALMDFVGRRVLEEAVGLLREDISIENTVRISGNGKDTTLAEALTQALQTRAPGGTQANPPQTVPVPEDEDAPEKEKGK
jgi:hypothetical protein